jgi:hypothetical protein
MMVAAMPRFSSFLVAEYAPCNAADCEADHLPGKKCFAGGLEQFFRNTQLGKARTPDHVEKKKIIDVYKKTEGSNDNRKRENAVLFLLHPVNVIKQSEVRPSTSLGINQYFLSKNSPGRSRRAVFRLKKAALDRRPSRSSQSLFLKHRVIVVRYSYTITHAGYRPVLDLSIKNYTISFYPCRVIRG